MELWMRFQKLFHFFIVYVQLCLPKGSFRFKLKYTYFYYYGLILLFFFVCSLLFKKLLWTCFAHVAMRSFYMRSVFYKKKYIFNIPVPQKRSPEILEIKILNATCCDLCTRTLQKITHLIIMESPWLWCWTSKISQSLIYYGRTMGQRYDRPAVWWSNVFLIDWE